MASSPLNKQTAICNLPDHWLMNVAMDLACMICGGKNGTNACHLAVFFIDVDFARYFISTRLPPPYRRTSVFGYASKNYLEWRAIQLAIHSIIGAEMD